MFRPLWGDKEDWEKLKTQAETVAGIFAAITAGVLAIEGCAELYQKAKEYFNEELVGEAQEEAKDRRKTCSKSLE